MRKIETVTVDMPKVKKPRAPAKRKTKKLETPRYNTKLPLAKWLLAGYSHNALIVARPVLADTGLVPLRYDQRYRGIGRSAYDVSRPRLVYSDVVHYPEPDHA